MSGPQDDSADSRAPGSLWLPVGLLVVGAVLLIGGVVLHAAGPIAPDTATSPSDFMEVGRLAAGRSIVALVCGAGLGWIGAHGVTGASASWIARQVVIFMALVFALALLQGLVLTAALCLVCCATAAIALVRLRGRR
ncbi:hypothetical protein Xcel_0294 [Xylanimonas cellulosilytica DSM 15894]|uniref:Uncharacterized protein n=1 Tax=Xylanimonas cellulosilytica (strain DSM 15894 / JCM 12276 / CECT 5975 / KCTC 9989 / LMG 20990 / NBRC 107835 / XIL07) TaxID=446471 RepID=D1BUU2_XYLCX|nr:hypothetical protein [Xylanimonas cellulosilytica]ACZ29333.1 hypothetical protein Xcel_0294 [Xylanimonas cellulosilytica DSM 15894]